MIKFVRIIIGRSIIFYIKIRMTDSAAELALTISAGNGRMAFQGKWVQEEADRAGRPTGVATSKDGPNRMSLPLSTKNLRRRRSAVVRRVHESFTNERIEKRPAE